MLKSYIIFFLLVFFCIHTDSQNITDSIVYWDKSKLLDWSLFEGKVDSGSNLHAVSSIQISPKGYWVNGNPNISVVCFFYRKKSWTTSTSSQDLLQHEQLHFDIGELFTRKTRKKVSELRERGESDIDVYYIELNIKKNGMRKLEVS